MTNQELLIKLIEYKEDTLISNEIFEIYEEGAEDIKIKNGEIKKSRRGWLGDADKYNDGKYTQKFHLGNLLKYKLKDNLKEKEKFSYGHMRNAALILYIREVIYEEDVSRAYEEVKHYYTQNRPINSPEVAKIAKDF